MWPFTTPYPERFTQQLNSEYDYIVVGGRLSLVLVVSVLSTVGDLQAEQLVAFLHGVWRKTKGSPCC